jgi:TrmH family RNA methyltransferase
MMITSGQNQKLKAACALKDRKERDQTGLFLIEGYREVRRAVDGGVQIIELFVCPEFFLGVNEEALIRETKGQVIECAPHVFEKLSYRDRPDGIVAVARQMGKKLSDLQLQDNPFFLVAEAIEKPGNLGTILRSADGSGTHGVIVCDRCTDIHNPNVVRASVGTLFTLPVLEATTEETLGWLKQHNIAVVAATPSATEEFTEADLSGPVAIVVGTEQLGLSKAWMEAATIRVKIPMLGSADSLNVGTATTLLLYEVVRQRHARLALR